MGQRRSEIEFIKYFVLNNKNTKYQNLGDVAEAMLRGKVRALNAYIRKKNDFKQRLKGRK